MSFRNLAEIKHDKTSWLPGPWHDEPDRLEWPDSRTGLPCLILRNVKGALCGYVGVARGHPDFGTNSGVLFEHITVHGGLTFSGFEDRDGADAALWYFGFDCSHLGIDYRPREASFGGESLRDTFEKFFAAPHLPDASAYRDLAYVRDECAKLASQLCSRGVH